MPNRPSESGNGRICSDGRFGIMRHASLRIPSLPWEAAFLFMPGKPYILKNFLNFASANIHNDGRYDRKTQKFSDKIH